jgi:hypothetical protein
VISFAAGDVVLVINGQTLATSGPWVITYVGTGAVHFSNSLDTGRTVRPVVEVERPRAARPRKASKVCGIPCLAAPLELRAAPIVHRDVKPANIPQRAAWPAVLRSFS